MTPITQIATGLDFKGSSACRRAFHSQFRVSPRANHDGAPTAMQSLSSPVRATDWVAGIRTSC
jgi:AraC-like DNA-binding protein